MDTDKVLLDKINAAVAEHNAAETDLVSKSRAVGLLLLEAKKLHPTKKSFEAFLRRVNGLHISRAYDLLRLAGGRTTDAELREDAAERQRKSRTKKKLNKPSPKPESVTSRTDEPKRTTASPEVSAEERRAQNAALDDDLPIPPFLDRTGGEAAKAERASEHALAQFLIACQTWLPKLTLPKHRQHACDVVVTLCCEQCREAA
jgi:hypothetical protein